MILVLNPHSQKPELVESLDGCAAEDGWALIADPAPVDYSPALYDVVGGALVPILAVARARQRAVINAARDAAQDGGVDTPSGRFDSASRSREFLNGAALAATLAGLNSQAFTVDWTLADNSVVTLDGAQIIAAGLAVAAWVDTVHQRAVVLKARIEAAETLAAIAAIEWSLTDPEETGGE